MAIKKLNQMMIEFKKFDCTAVPLYCFQESRGEVLHIYPCILRVAFDKFTSWRHFITH